MDVFRTWALSWNKLSPVFRPFFLFSPLSSTRPLVTYNVLLRGFSSIIGNVRKTLSVLFIALALNIASSELGATLVLLHDKSCYYVVFVNCCIFKYVILF